MGEGQHAAPVEERFDDLGGYRQELRRALGPFQVFAISFAFISVAVGIFGTYDDVLKNAGPAGIWLWPIVAVGQTLIALVIAQELLLPGGRRGDGRRCNGEHCTDATVRNAAGR